MPFTALNRAPFSSSANSTLEASAVTSNVALGGTGNTLLVQNEGPETVFFALGTASIVAVSGGIVTAANTGGTPILSGAVMTILISTSATHVAGIVKAGGAATILRLSRGVGE